MNCSIEFRESASPKDACFRVEGVEFDNWTGVELKLVGNDAVEFYEKSDLTSCESDQQCTEWCQLTTADQLESSILFQIKNTNAETICSAEVTSNQAGNAVCSSRLEPIYQLENEIDKIEFIEKLSETERIPLSYRWTTTGKCYRIQRGIWMTSDESRLQYSKVLT